MTFLALVLNRPMVLMKPFSRSSPRASIFCGVSASLNSSTVALLTLTSVAWADRTTATRRVKGLMYSSSPRGLGLSAASRLKN